MFEIPSGMRKKHRFVAAVSDALALNGAPGIDCVEYEAYVHMEKGLVQEYVVMHYGDKSISPKSVNGADLGVTMAIIGDLAATCGAYVDEIQNREDVMSDPDWEKVDFTAPEAKGA